MAKSRRIPSHAELHLQAINAARQFLEAARENIDDVMGEGAADENPGLVAAFVQATSADYLAATLREYVSTSIEGVGEAVRLVAEASSLVQRGE